MKACLRHFPGACLALLLPAATAQDTAQWRQVYSVLSHPRCLNCHTTTEYPRQGDERRRHAFGVVRGQDGKGPPGALCMSCHTASNNAATGVPGLPNWHAAPRSMSWEARPGVAMDSGRLCSTLKDRSKNHNMDLQALAHHHKSDALVKWAWTPGTRADGAQRVQPPLTHQEFTTVFNEWAAMGGPCPSPTESISSVTQPN